MEGAEGRKKEILSCAFTLKDHVKQDVKIFLKVEKKMVTMQTV